MHHCRRLLSSTWTPDKVLPCHQKLRVRNPNNDNIMIIMYLVDPGSMIMCEMYGVDERARNTGTWGIDESHVDIMTAALHYYTAGTVPCIRRLNGDYIVIE
ncbi:hypothetical protein NEOLEDRAFT_274518 [Neolentinus lepideus HHB14362 ss-1]|uniref:Uncharacterized protein n=1 Tax=Neolentinus lepideus HHB14362 ss-1 TaxID=1314782 RepID=A0A165T5M1_9AGAM|nr:hypothetical protein NEOLEDRAFT_274518 [Neolentinus lepideus HHB14362 ss-1]